MSNQFDNLMNKYGSEAEQQKAAEFLAAEARKRAAKVRKFILILLLLGASAAAYVYRDQVKQTYGVIAKALKIEKPKAEASAPGENTKNKAKDLQKIAEKRNEQIEAVLK